MAALIFVLFALVAVSCAGDFPNAAFVGRPIRQVATATPAPSFTVVASSYGVRSGSLQTTIGSIKAGTSTLLLQSALDFVTGQYVSVGGAGPNGSNFVAQIVRGGGTTSLTLNAAATSSVAGASVQHDDAPLLTDAFAAARSYRRSYSSAAVEVLIPSGDYNLTTPVNATGLSAITVLCNGNLMGNSGSIAVDGTGATSVSWLQMTISIPNGFSSFGEGSGASTIGLLLANGAGNTLINPHIEVVQNPQANGGSGSAAMYVAGAASTNVVGGWLFGDNGAVFTNSNIFGIESAFGATGGGASTNGQMLLNTELDGGNGYPLVVENSSNDTFKVYSGGGVNGALPSNGQAYAMRLLGTVANSSFIGNVEVWPGAIFFDDRTEPLSITNDIVSLDMWNGSGNLMALGTAAAPNPISSFNGNDFRLDSLTANYIAVNNPNFAIGAGDGNTFLICTFQALDQIWTSTLTNTIRILN
jgi:hypothetical protein